jgi:hypothetical protein
MNKPLRFWLGLALVVVPLAGQLLTVFFLGVNTPSADEFAYIDFIRALREGGRWLPMLFYQHNEHRVVPVKMTMALLQPFVGWNPKVEMYVSVLLAGLVLLGLWRLYRRAGGTDLLLFAPAAWLFCNLAQYENMLYGLQMCHYFTVAGVVWALVFLDESRMAPAVLCGLVASWSILNGLLVWPLGLFLLLARGERPSRAAVWTGLGIATFVLYFANFQVPGFSALHPGARDVPHMVRYALMTLGAPLAAESFPWSFALGLAVLAATAALAFVWIRKGRERLRADILLAALLLFGLLSCALIAAGRALTGVSPLQPRYIAYTSLAFVSLYLFAARSAETSRGLLTPGLAAALALLVPGVIAGNVQGFREAEGWHRNLLREQLLLQTFDRQPDALLAEMGLKAEYLSKVPYLRDQRLTAFGEPQHLLLITRWNESQAVGPILPDRPVELRLRCPVGVLYDAGVALSRQGPAFDSAVTVSLWDGNRRIAAHQTLVASLASGFVGLIPLRLPAPLLGCQGRELTVRIETPGASPAAGVTAWTYPAYYDGDLRQAGEPLAPGRSLGLALNGYHFDLLK